MNKKTILYHPVTGLQSLVCNKKWHPYLLDYFNIEPYDVTATYNKVDYVLWAWWKESNWYQDLVDDGYKLVHDYLWDHSGTPVTTNNVLNLKSPNWIIANQRLLRDNNTIIPIPTKPTKFMLCLMNAERDHRTQLYDNIKQYHASSLISYASRNVFIPDDIAYNNASGEWQTYVNQSWYSTTQFSLVAETTMEDDEFISEKSIKPFAYKHPMIILGHTGILDRFKKLGFATFSHKINESYDTIPSDVTIEKKFIDKSYYYSSTYHSTSRITAVTEVVAELYREYADSGNSVSLFGDSLSAEIIEHNFNHLYSETFISGIIQKEILDPILEFINTQ